jgi:hypothetical protein
LFRSIVEKLPTDKDLPARVFTVDVNRRVLEGALYEHMKYGFHQEQTDSGEYIPLRDRRPSVRYNLCRLVVDDSVSLLFSEGHFPIPQSDDKAVKDALIALIKDAKLNAVMLEAATQGSVGSVAVQLAIYEQKATQGQPKAHRAFYRPHCTEYLTPTFDPFNPDVLIGLREQYKIKGAAVKAMGFPVIDEDMGVDFWFLRTWDDQAETWFQPFKVSESKDAETAGKPFVPTVDEKRTVTHGLGFVPWVWIRNLPGKLRLIGNGQALTYSDIDGACTFSAAVDTMVEIEYQLSQGGRGLKYSMDPTLVLKEPAMPSVEDGTGTIVKSPTNALVVDGQSGDAKLLELGGSAFQVVLEWVRALRELAMESAHGNRAEASKLSTAQSGRAMELMNQSLIWLADKLRVSYGEGALLQLLRMTLAAHAKFPLTVAGNLLPALNTDASLSLNWPKWQAPTTTDLKDQAGTLNTLVEGGLLSKPTAIGQLANDYDIEDVAAEQALILADEAAASARAIAEAAQIKAAQTVES